MTSALLQRGAPALAALLLATVPAASAAADTSPPPGAESDAAPDTGKGRIVIGEGHVDIGPRFDHGRWTVQIRDDSARPAVWRNTADVVLQVKDAARIEVPESKEFAFLGEPGDQVWLLPQVQQDGVLWPGWNSQEPKVAAGVEREVTWKLNRVRGPGDFVLFLNGSFGTPTVLFDGKEKFPQETGIEVNSHVHGNWAFSKPGTYLLDVSMSARTKDGKNHDSERTLQFSVGPQDPASAFVTKTSVPKTPLASESQEDDAGGAAASPVSSDASAPLWWVGAATLAVVAAGGALLWRRSHGNRTATAQAVPAERTEQ
ncbi:TIGR03773 family transporter-associated surface protein [Streptomyces sp. NPDC046984]|uniref:TIGR03773 family transporter-associated surface protein n=1 Tax=Streptomyces sp. NPDC046984 TaxID=3155138 RepID=UPI0033F04789